MSERERRFYVSLAMLTIALLIPSLFWSIPVKIKWGDIERSPNVMEEPCNCVLEDETGLSNYLKHRNWVNWRDETVLHALARVWSTCEARKHEVAGLIWPAWCIVLITS